MPESWTIAIAGLTLTLECPRDILAELHAIYDDFQRRADTFKADPNNPHLCRAGCSHCCKHGAVFAVTLAEALQWSLAIDTLPEPARTTVRSQARDLLDRQHRSFAAVPGPADAPGRRDEPLFSSRITRLNSTSPACPLLISDLCSVYHDRPMLCRAYGFPVDAWAVHSDNAIVFRSLCHLYQDARLTDYIRAKDIRERLRDLSTRLAAGRDPGRFTSPEAILATITRI